MRISLSVPPARWIFLLVVIFTFAAICYSAGKACLAAAWSASTDPQGWKAAIRLEPQNASYFERWGLYRQWELDQRDLGEAVRYLERAVQLDPLSAKFRLELASAYEIQGDEAHAHQAYEAAKLEYPISADVAWRYGSFLLRQKDFAAGFTEIRRALEHDATLETSAISECWESDPDVAAIVDQALPRRSDAYLAALDYFVSQGRADAAQIVWTRLLKLEQPFPMARALPFVDELISEDRIGAAKRTWDEALLTTGWARDSKADESLVFNSSFENEKMCGGGIVIRFSREEISKGMQKL